MKKSKLPKNIIVYICDYDDGKPVLAVSDNGVSGIPEDSAGELMGIYKLVQSGRLKVSKTII